MKGSRLSRYICLSKMGSQYTEILPWFLIDTGKQKMSRYRMIQVLLLLPPLPPKPKPQTDRPSTLGEEG